MAKRKFNDGDRVEIISPKNFKDLTGVIIKYDNSLPNPYVIKLDKPLNDGGQFLSMSAGEIRNTGG